MTRLEFVKKYKGAVPDVAGRTAWKSWSHLEDEMMHDLTLIIPDDQTGRINECMAKAVKLASDVEDAVATDFTEFKEYVFLEENLQELIKFCLNYNGVIKWINFNRQEKRTYPPVYDKYLVCRKDGKVNWEVWNTSGWAYNGNVIVYYAKIVQPVI